MDELRICKGIARWKAGFIPPLETYQPTGSGLSQMQFSNDNSTWSEPENYATSKSWVLTSGNGLKTVYAKFKDVANNWLSSTSVMTDESGSQVKYLEYQPYGDTKVEEGSLNVKRKFTGKELDEETGLYDYGARHYDARVGRFVSADTVDPNLANPQSLNRYSYCLNNPLRYIDPNGHEALEYEITAGAVIVAGYYIFTWVQDNIKNHILVFPQITINFKLPGFGEGVQPKRQSTETFPSESGIKYVPEGMTYADLPNTSVKMNKTIKARHYTDKAGKEKIKESGKLKKHTFVTKPGEIPKDASQEEIEKKLAIEKGRGEYHVDVQVKESDLYVPGKQHGGETTKGGAWQRRLKKDYPINPDKFK